MLTSPSNRARSSTIGQKKQYNILIVLLILLLPSTLSPSTLERDVCWHRLLIDFGCHVKFGSLILLLMLQFDFSRPVKDTTKKLVVLHMLKAAVFSASVYPSLHFSERFFTPRRHLMGGLDVVLSCMCLHLQSILELYRKPQLVQVLGHKYIF